MKEPLHQISFRSADSDEHASARTVVEDCIEAMAEPRPGLLEFFGEMGAPPLDMAVTVMTARAALLGAEQGRAFYHHELRGRIPMPGHLEPEVEVWESGTVPVWQEGVLVEPKYFSFFQDGPFAAYNPNHRRKWRAHELLHGAVGFFWRPDMTRFEFYVGTRLNEILPVVHWYNLDEVFRPRCERHLGQVLHREWCRNCERAARPFWQAKDVFVEEMRARAESFVEAATSHLKNELDACRMEIEDGEVVEIARGKLNSSSDAIGYLKGHWNRCTAWSFGSWAERFLREGEDYTSDLERYLERVDQTFGRLLSGSVGVSPEAYIRLRGRRTLQDIGYRTFLALESLDEGSPAANRAEDALLPGLDVMAEAADAILRGENVDSITPIEELLSSWAEVAPVFAEEVRTPFDAFAFVFDDHFERTQSELASLMTGLQSGMPETTDELESLESASRAFAKSEHLMAQGRLAGRFAAFLDDLDDPLKSLARFEAWVLDEPRRDEEAETFAALPDDVSALQKPGRLRLNETFRRSGFPGRVIERVFGESTGPSELAGVVFNGELRLAEVDGAAAEIFDRLEAGDSRASWLSDVDPDTLLGLLSSGFVVWLPAPR